MKTAVGFVGFGALVLGMAGCSGSGGAHHVVAPSGGYADVAESPAGPPASPPGGYAQPSPRAAEETVLPAPASAAPPPPMTAEPRAEMAPAPSAPPSREEDRSASERPGLGTEWGETRFSQVHDVPFERASETPFTVATIRYDDRAGVDAMLARHPHTSSSSDDVSVGGGWVSVSIRDDRGSPLDALRLGDRSYVVGRAGERYAIILRNGTGHRFEAVATVDGLDVINGKPGNFSNRGYLLDAHGTLEIDGFRQSDDTVAAFRFGRVGDSYAAQTGSARDVGVIGVAFFAERGDGALAREARLRDTASPFPADPRYARPPWQR